MCICILSLKECKKGSPIIVSSWISSTTDAPPSTYLEKKGMNKKSHWVKTRHETPVVKKRTDSTFNSEDEILSRSVVRQANDSCLKLNLMWNLILITLMRIKWTKWHHDDYVSVCLADAVSSVYFIQFLFLLQLWIWVWAPAGALPR